jgi:hypothetical protein
MNSELLARVRTLIEAGAPVDMDTWSCGTAACIGGWAVQLAGFHLVEETRVVRKWDWFRLIERHVSAGHVCLMGDTRAEVHDAARAALGLTEAEADSLFYVDMWPADLSAAYELAELVDDADGMRAAVLARIDRMLRPVPTPEQIDARVREVVKA